MQLARLNVLQRIIAKSNMAPLVIFKPISMAYISNPCREQWTDNSIFMRRSYTRSRWEGGRSRSSIRKRSADSIRIYPRYKAGASKLLCRASVPRVNLASIPHSIVEAGNSAQPLQVLIPLSTLGNSSGSSRSSRAPFA